MWHAIVCTQQNTLRSKFLVRGYPFAHHYQCWRFSFVNWRILSISIRTSFFKFFSVRLFFSFWCVQRIADVYTHIHTNDKTFYWRYWKIVNRIYVASYNRVVAQNDKENKGKQHSYSQIQWIKLKEAGQKGIQSKKRTTEAACTNRKKIKTKIQLRWSGKCVKISFVAFHHTRIQ